MRVFYCQKFISLFLIKFIRLRIDLFNTQTYYLTKPTAKPKTSQGQPAQRATSLANYPAVKRGDFFRTKHETQISKT
jgi:hypothetical protein